MEGKLILLQSHAMPVDSYKILTLPKSHIWESTSLPPSSTDGVQAVIWTQPEKWRRAVFSAPNPIPLQLLTWQLCDYGGDG